MYDGKIKTMIKRAFINTAIVLGIAITLLVSCQKEEDTDEFILTTDTVKVIAFNSAICGGNILSDGGLDIIARGICWDTIPEPTIDDNISVDTNGTGKFTSTLTRLLPNTVYYVRAYAKSITDTYYGQEVSFATMNKTIELSFCTIVLLLYTLNGRS